MALDVLKILWVVHAVVLTVAAGGFFRFWVRSRFWVPTYVHVLAALGLAVGVFCVTTAPDDAPVSHWDTPTRLLAGLVVPAMVYFFFVFYGGQRIAFEARTTPCPKCGHAIPPISEAPAELPRLRSGRACVVCGQALA